MNCSWYVLGQLLASVALECLSESDPYNFRIAIYTQVSRKASELPLDLPAMLTLCLSGP